MAKESTIQHYTSSITGNTPSAVDLASGELAINIADEKVFLKNLLGNVVSLSQSKDLSGAFASKATVVTSFNGATGAVNYSPAFASSSVTGVASFSSGNFAVSATGHVTVKVGGIEETQLASGAKPKIGNLLDLNNGAINEGTFIVYDPGRDGYPGHPDYNPQDPTVDHFYAPISQYYSPKFASASVTGVASFNSTYFAVGATGVVTLASAYQVTGQTVVSGGGSQILNTSGNTVTIDNRVASSSVTGVASFNSTYLTVSNGAVSLASAYQVTGDTVAAGTGISVSKSGNTSTVTNIGVQSFNGATGAVTGASLGANTFTALNSFNAGISASGATFTGNVSAQSTLYTNTILAIGNQINIANASGGRIAFGDYDGAGNSTYVFIRDGTSNLLISNPYGDVGIGDPNNVDSGYALLYNAAAGSLDGGNSFLTNFNTGSFNGLLTANGGISAAAFNGATGSFSKLLTTSAGISAGGTTAANFNGLVDMSFNTLFEPTLRYYNEVLASPAITANVLTLDLSTAQMFTVSLNANITTFTISNTPATANRSIGFTLIFTADGTARTVTWGAAVKWANNDPPALTSTNAKKDILSFVSPDGGTTWYGFIGGLNF